MELPFVQSHKYPFLEQNDELAAKRLTGVLVVTEVLHVRARVAWTF